VLRVQAIGAIGAGAPVEVEGHTIIVRDDMGNPIMVAQEIADGMTTVTTCADPDFDKTLRVLGIDKLEIEPLKAPSPPKGSSRLDPNNLGDFINDASKKA
jgi:hypothetical protein